MPWPDAVDRCLRGLLRLPGVVVERLDGTVVLPPDGGPDAVASAVIATRRHPEALLALEDDLHHVVHGGCVVGFQHRGRTAFAVGGLNAPDGTKAALLRAFAEHTSRRGIARQLVFPVRPDELDAVRSAGFSPVQVGVEAWLDLEDLTFAGGRFAHVRQMRNRARRRGVEVMEVDPAGWRDRLDAVHRAWLRSKRPSWRMKLLVGSPSLDRPADRRYFAAVRDGRAEAFVTVLPATPGAWGVDVMARRPDAVPGTMERLLVHVAETLRDEGATVLALGPCPMAGVPLARERWVLTATFRLLYATRLGNRVFGFRSLVAFKEKFRPRWTPVYFAAAPRLGVGALYRGCRMWGLY